MHQKNAKHARRKRIARGFTLMELLVVTSIFSTVVLMASDIFLLANRTERRVFGSARVQADARFAMEAMVREIRTGKIDYDYYKTRGTPVTMPDKELALIGSDGYPIRFTLSSSASQCANAKSSPCLLVTTVDPSVPNNPPTITETITPQDETIQTLKFYVTPMADPSVFSPLTGTYASNVQPRVTILLVVKSINDKLGDQSVVSVQTTATTRAFTR
jgi:prepilin-type N-terminal cleavage/methylation domain-containing protein